MKKAIAAICCALLACTGCVWGAQMMAQEENSFSTGAVLPPDHLFTTMDEEGRLVIMDTAQMEAQTAAASQEQGMQIPAEARTVDRMQARRPRREAKR